MQIELPDINEIISRIEPIVSSYNGEEKTISAWVLQQREIINNHRELVKSRTEDGDIKIFLVMLRDYLTKAMRGEMGEKVYERLKTHIHSKTDLQYANYVAALKEASYRWGAEIGASVIEDIVDYFKNELEWNFSAYFELAEQNYRNNFKDDKLLKIRNIGYKVRDLALSSFSGKYVAFDLHLCRVPTRMGLLSYGYELIAKDLDAEHEIEMGNNPQNLKNYHFLHRLFVKLTEMTDNKYSMSDFDRFFWHFGKSFCGSKPQCDCCPVVKICLTGRHCL